MKRRSGAELVGVLCAIAMVIAAPELCAQNFDRYKPQILPPRPDPPRIPLRPVEPVVGSDQVLIAQLESLVVLDRSEKVDATNPLDLAAGLSIKVDDSESLIYSDAA